jgi:hypothetical protein
MFRGLWRCFYLSIFILLALETGDLNAQDQPPAETAEIQAAPGNEQPPTETGAASGPNAMLDSPTSGQQRANKWTSRDIAYLISPLISLIGVGLIVYFTRKNAISEQWLKINEAEANYIQEKLDKFYGPFLLESEANLLMANDMRSRQPDPRTFRLLAMLFNPDWRDTLSEGDQALVAEICDTGERLANLIKENAGLVDPAILPYIARALTHFRTLKLAYDGKLGNDSAPYLHYIYPKALDPVIEAEVARLQDRLLTLKQNPTKPHGDLAPLDLSSHQLDAWPNPPRAV